MCKHILVVKYVDGGKHAIKECADKAELDANILDAQSKPGTSGYEVFDLVSKVTKSIEWREVDVTVESNEASNTEGAEAQAAGSGDGKVEGAEPNGNEPAGVGSADDRTTPAG